MKNTPKNLLGALVGATASGKTAESLIWAQKLNAEIISADSRQIYKGFKVGTAQPTLAEREICPHHFVDFLEADQKFSVGAFVKETVKLIEANPETQYIIVGGTGFYVHALQNGLLAEPEITERGIQSVQDKLADWGLEKLQARLAEFDPVAHQRIEKNDKYRVVKAWEVFESTGQTWSSFLANKTFEGWDFPIYEIVREREELYKRINIRTEKMLQDGWLEEVSALLGRGISPDCFAMQTLGYPEVRMLLNKEITPEKCYEYISLATRRYAKRQLTFFRNKLTLKTFPML